MLSVSALLQQLEYEYKQFVISSSVVRKSIKSFYLYLIDFFVIAHKKSFVKFKFLLRKTKISYGEQ